MKRIVLDVKDIMSVPIDNIMYIPHEEVITIGYAMIIGPKNTPYENGFYFLNFISRPTIHSSHPRCYSGPLTVKHVLIRIYTSTAMCVCRC